ncbi:NAD+ synthetase [Desulfatibacillum aliphaticivorans]|uniref:Glutamine-dependent NAD(+) synthetase n=1 Tax=Desulfatibacillum aliphaticivorans TaxID=218208 RepID=B8FDJ1_DESAL|nr:NAD(+) synthase [Desulfatibacillum aliphaticivorans]ACL06622.1 NAD+ synthetase [Desulfatibacillum aliphaticivorans]
MKIIRIAAASLNQTPLDWKGNMARIRQAVSLAEEAGANFLLLPELCITGYGCEDAFSAHFVIDCSHRFLVALARETPNMAVIVGLPVLHRKAVYNCAAVLAGGKVLGLVPKQHLAGDGLHYEPRWFRPWKPGVQDEWQGGVPMGDIDFDVNGIRFGLEICEDAWVADRPGARLARRGADIIFNPSASHFSIGKTRIRRNFVIDGSRAFGCAYVYANLLGNEAGRAVYDGGNMIAFAGELTAASPRLGFEDVVLTTATVDVDLGRAKQARTGSFEPMIEPDGDCIKAAIEWEDVRRLDPPAVDHAPWEDGPKVKEQEFTRAIALALFDYLRKSRARGFVVSLSGGADSTACALLVRTMVRLGLNALGPEEFVKKLGVPGLKPNDPIDYMVERLLICVYQATENSSKASQNAARQVAASLGATFYNLDVEPLAAGYRSMIEHAVGRALTWEQDDIGLQNIQARTRAPGVWLLANVYNMLLLSTSNRSEAAVGYATMDGDTCGSIAPIAGIDKDFLLKWLRWMFEAQPFGPCTALELVLQQKPSAELRPAALDQTDEADLMPYDALNFIELQAIRDKQGPTEAYFKTCTAFPNTPEERVYQWIEKFFTLWSGNQWKRERYAPSFHVDDENLDPKTWCRFPILSGGFDLELAELRAEIIRLKARQREE